jgi:hypothetical protein
MELSGPGPGGGPPGPPGGSQEEFSENKAGQKKKRRAAMKLRITLVGRLFVRAFHVRILRNWMVQ